MTAGGTPAWPRALIPSGHRNRLHTVAGSPAAGPSRRLTRLSAASAVDEAQQILAVGVVAHGLGDPSDVVRGDQAQIVGNLLETRDHQTLPLFDRLDEGARLEQRLVGAGVEPGDAAAEHLHVERPRVQVGEVDVGDLELAASRRLEPAGDLEHRVVVEVETGHRVRGARRLRLLLEADRVPGAVELDDAVALGISHPVAEHGGARLSGGSAPQELREAVAVEDVVTEGQRYGVIADEGAADDERLGQALGARLHGIIDREPEMTAILEQAAEGLLVLRRRDHQNLADAGEHQRRKGVINHRFVVDGDQLLADRAREGIESRAGAAGEDDALHRIEYSTSP